MGGTDYRTVAYRVSFEDLRTPPQYHARSYPDADYPESGQDVRLLKYQEIYEINGVLPPFDAINLAPLARHDQMLLLAEAGTNQWHSLGSVLTNDRDAEAEPLTATLVDRPPQGALTLQLDGAFTYTPTNSVWISDTFTYRAQDQRHESNLATVTLVPVAAQLYLPVSMR